MLMLLVPWLKAFFVTQLLEMPIYGYATRSVRTAFLASAMTHPIVWFVFPLLPVPYWVMVALAETFAVSAESLWLHVNGMPKRSAFLWSLAANATSVTFGLMIRAATGWV
ncbi:MAG: hypothetical protein ACO1OB_09800 [Archangium sp.]